MVDNGHMILYGMFSFPKCNNMCSIALHVFNNSIASKRFSHSDHSLFTPDLDRREVNAI